MERGSSESDVAKHVCATNKERVNSERVNLVRAAIQILSEDHRTILVLREMQERSYEDIAEILEISIGTVRSRLSRARNQLKVTLEAMENDEEAMPGSDSVS